MWRIGTGGGRGGVGGRSWARLGLGLRLGEGLGGVTVGHCHGALRTCEAEVEVEVRLTRLVGGVPRAR